MNWSPSYLASRGVFDRYGAHDGPLDELPQPWARAQVTAARWEASRFAAPDVALACVLSEEVGEFVDALDGDSPGRQQHIFDELGDVLVASAQLATASRLDLFCTGFGDFSGHMPDPAGRAQRRAIVDKLPTILAYGAGCVARVAVKGSLKLRGLDDRETYRAAMHAALRVLLYPLASQFSIQYLGDAFRVAAERVSRRTA